MIRSQIRHLLFLPEHLTSSHLKDSWVSQQIAALGLCPWARHFQGCYFVRAVLLCCFLAVIFPCWSSATLTNPSPAPALKAGLLLMTHNRLLVLRPPLSSCAHIAKSSAVILQLKCASQQETPGVRFGLTQQGLVTSWWETACQHWHLALWVPTCQWPLSDSFCNVFKHAHPHTPTEV